MELYNKDLVFSVYPSLQLLSRGKCIKKIEQMRFDREDILWVVTEKIHGSNFSIHFNGEKVMYARRNDFLTNLLPVPCEEPAEYFKESFFNAAEHVKKFHNNLPKVFQTIKQRDPKMVRFTIYGQFFGGLWPSATQQNVAQGYKPVQKEVYYSPKHEFFAFDIQVFRSTENYWVNANQIKNYLGQYIPTVPIYAQGTFQQMIDMQTRFDSTIPSLLGLKHLEDNISEGLVIRPNSDLKTTKSERIILKNKNKEFIEKTKAPKVKVKELVKQEKEEKKEEKKDEQDKEEQGSVSVDQDELEPYFVELLQYLNQMRVASVVSKFPDLKDKEEIKRLVLDDMLDDARKDDVKLHPSKELQKRIRKRLKRHIIKEVNEYFKDQ